MFLLIIFFAGIAAWALLTLRDGVVGKIQVKAGPTRCAQCDYALAGLLRDDEPADGSKVCPECGAALHEQTVVRATLAQRVYASRRRATTAFAVVAVSTAMFVGGMLTNAGAYTTWSGGSAQQQMPGNGPLVVWSWSTQTPWRGWWADQRLYPTYRAMTVRIGLSDGGEIRMVMPRSYPGDERGWLRAEFHDADGTVARTTDKPLRVDLQRWIGRNAGKMPGLRDSPVVDEIASGVGELVIFGDPVTSRTYMGTQNNGSGTKQSWTFTLPWGAGPPLLVAGVLTRFFYMLSTRIHRPREEAGA